MAAGDRGDEVENVAAIQRSFVGFAFVNDLAKRRIIGLQQWSLRGDFHGLGVCADLQDGVNAGTLLHLHVNGFALETLEAGLIHIHGVLTWIQVDEGVGDRFDL